MNKENVIKQIITAIVVTLLFLALLTYAIVEERKEINNIEVVYEEVTGS